MMDASTSHRIASFKYNTLPDAAGYVRLLEVLDDDYSENIKVRCRISTWLVDNIPKYHAISYTWGDPEPESTILVNCQVFRVRTNCEFVLKQAYWYNKTYYYWIDAICINQENLGEKSMQVSIMGSIYKKADRVLACVGDHADDSAFLVHKLKQRAFTKGPNPRYSGMRLSLSFQLGQRFSTTVRFLRAVLCFMERPYFTRLWILQELRNAQEVTFLCGLDAVPRRVIYDMSEGIQHHLESILWAGKSSSIATNISRRLPVFRRFWTVPEYWRKYSNYSKRDQRLLDIARRAWLLVCFRDDIPILMSAARELECQERKDKIFGLISLIDWGGSAPLIPDYTQTELEVTVSFFQALLNA